MNVQRHLLLLVTLAAIVTPASAQQLAPAAAPANMGAHSAVIPDFSDIWSHPSFPGFEPPASGPGPVVNKSRRPQVNFDGRILPADNVQKAAGHRDSGTTKLYDRRSYNPEKAASFFATY
jgi:hypothetical protein